MVPVASSRRLSTWTTPVSHSPGSSSAGTRSVRSKSQRGADVRIRRRVAGLTAPTALTISICRDAWPKPCPEM